MKFRTSFFLSFAVHVGIILIVCFGMPSWRKAPELLAPIPVELVTVGKETMAPKVDPVPQKGVDIPTKPPVEPPKTETPPPPPPVVEAPPAGSEVEPEPIPEPAPKPDAVPVVKTDIVPDIKPTIKPEKPKKVEKNKKKDPKPPKKKEKTPKNANQDKSDDSFESLLKNLDTTVPVDDDGAIEDKNPPKPARKITGKLGDSLTQSQLDALGRQFTPCWLFPDVKDGKNITVLVRIFLNGDKTVRDAQLKDSHKLSDPHYRALAESALRAARDPRCAGPLDVPAGYASESILYTFDPSKML